MSGGFEGRLSTLWGGVGSVASAAAAFPAATAADSVCDDSEWLCNKGFERK